MAWQFFRGGSGQEKIEEAESTPVGLIVQYGGLDIPVGWLPCDGSQKLIASYPDLYKVLGNNHGNATSTHFYLPDLRGRTPVGCFEGSGDGSVGQGSITGTSISQKTIGSWRGTESVTLSASESGFPAHNHTIAAGNHSHSVTVNNSGNHNHGYGWNWFNFKYQGGMSVLLQASTFGPYFRWTSYSTPGASIPGGTSGVTSTNQEAAQDATNAHQNIQPSIVVNFMIKA